jgi:hypothetical protein
MCARLAPSALLPIFAVRARLQALLTAALLAALVVPATALGQSAGDEQYSDPFGQDQQQEQQPQQEQPQQEQPAQQPEAPPEPIAPAPTDASGVETPAPAQSSDPSLPVTGLRALTLLALGAGMLASGLLMRRRA